MRFPFEKTATSATAKWTCKRIATPAPCSSHNSAFLLVTLAVISLGLGGCKCQSETDEPQGEEPAAESAPAPAPRKSTHAVSLFDIQDRCMLRHQGLVLDMGDDAARARRMFRLTEVELGPVTSRTGIDFRLFDQMNTDFVFWLTEELSNFEFSAGVHGLASERMAAYVDGARLGAASIKPDRTTMIRISGRDKVLAPGRHKLTLALSRPSGGTPAADVSWVRIGPSVEEPESPATRKETLSEVSIEKKGLRSVVLRPGSSLRCPVWIPKGARLFTEWGIWGEGAAEAEIIVHTKDGKRLVVAASERQEDDPRAFAPLEADLSPFASQFVDIELSAPRALARTRVAFGRPELRSPAQSAKRPVRARRAILILLSGLSARHAPPSSAEHGLPFLNQLSREAAAFPNYRTSTSSVSGVVASVFSGLPPWLHGVEKKHDSLSPAVVTLASQVEAEGGRSSFFTGVPLTFEPFGLARGFAQFEAILPQEDRPATEPLLLAKEWLASRLDHDGPVLSVVHLRGGHPPLDVSKSDAVDLPPKEYGGDHSPRRAAIQLADIRARRSRRHRRMPDEDWTRLHALQKAALIDQSAALSDFVSWLRQHDAYDDTLLVVAGDAGAGDRPQLPFRTNAELSEDVLSPPLLVKFPAGNLRATRIRGAFAPRDVAQTIAAALNIDFAQRGLDLAAPDAPLAASSRPHMAYRSGDYSMLFGPHLLLGSDGSAPTLCQPALDPTCQRDRASSNPLEMRALWLSAWAILEPTSESQSTATPTTPEEELDEQFRDSLTVWGVDD